MFNSLLAALREHNRPLKRADCSFHQHNTAVKSTGACVHGGGRLAGDDNETVSMITEHYLAGKCSVAVFSVVEYTK